MGTQTARTRRVRQLHHDPASLVWVRKQAGFTQAKLAEALGISPSHMSEIESGKRNCTAKNLAKAAKVLGCPVAVIRAKVAVDEQAA